jgi:hypothetical protein
MALTGKKKPPNSPGRKLNNEGINDLVQGIQKDHQTQLKKIEENYQNQTGIKEYIDSVVIAHCILGGSGGFVSDKYLKHIRNDYPIGS